MEESRKGGNIGGNLKPGNKEYYLVSALRSDIEIFNYVLYYVCSQ